jgi:hypothetical protein
VAFASTIGITAAALFILLMDNTFLTGASHGHNVTAACNITAGHLF